MPRISLPVWLMTVFLSLTAHAPIAPDSHVVPWEELGAHVERDKSGRLTWLEVTHPTVEDKDLENFRRSQVPRSVCSRRQQTEERRVVPNGSCISEPWHGAKADYAPTPGKGFYRSIDGEH